MITVACYIDEGFNGDILQVSGKTSTFERTVNIVQFIEQSVTEWKARHEHKQHADEHEVLVDDGQRSGRNGSETQM